MFDADSVAGRAEAMLPGRGADLARLWRTKQLEYTWLGSLMDARRDFAVVTRRSTTRSRRWRFRRCERTRVAVGRLADARTLSRRRACLMRLVPRPRWILSSGTLDMLERGSTRAGLQPHLDGVLSVGAAGIYKPFPPVHALACDRLRLAPERIGFVSSHEWDATGAKAFGFTTWWVHRSGLPVERHGPARDWIVGSLDEVGH